MAATNANASLSDESLAQQRKEHEREIDALNKRYKKAEFERETKFSKERKKAEEQFTNEITERSNEVTQKSKQVTEAHHKCSELSGELAQAKTKIAQLEKKIAREYTIKGVQNQIEENGEKLDRIGDDLKLQVNNDLTNFFQTDTSGLKSQNETLTTSNANLSDQVTCAKSKITELTRNLEMKTEEVAHLKETLKAKKKRKQECLEEERKRMQGLNDNYVKALGNSHAEELTKKGVEMEQLRASQYAEIKRMKGELMDVQTERAADQATLKIEKQRLEDEYVKYKTNLEESLKRQQDDSMNQKDEDIRRMEGEITNDKKQIDELKLALNKARRHTLKLTEEHDTEHLHEKENLEKKINSLRSDLSSKNDEIRNLQSKVSRLEKSTKTH